jgi:threonine/homoserine/homoserine lactone efflux protein
MALGAMAAYTDPENHVGSVLIIGLVFALVNVPSVSVWAGFGTALRGFLSDPLRLKRFNIAMGAALGALPLADAGVRPVPLVFTRCRC